MALPAQFCRYFVKASPGLPSPGPSAANPPARDSVRPPAKPVPAN